MNGPRSLYGALIAQIEKGNGDRTALIDNRESYTFTDLVRAIDLCAEELAGLGIGKGDHVGLWAQNSIGWLVNFYAVIKTGAVAVLLNYSLTDKEISAQLVRNDVRFLLYGRNKLTINGEDIISIAGSAGIPASCVCYIDDRDYKKDSAGRKIAPFTEMSEEQCKNDVAFLIFTTGTTSLPKAAQLSQYGLVRDSLIYDQINPNVETEVPCIAIPLFHIFALISVTIALNNGVSAIIVSDLHVADIIEMASIHKASKLITVGALHQKIVEHPDFKAKLSEQIVSLAGGGSGLTQTQFLRIESAYKNASFINGYGMTEAGGIIAIPRITDSMDIRSKATGMIYPGKTVRIMNGNGEILPAGSIGEVVVLDEGNLMKGYYNIPEDEQPFDDKGYFHTGDMGYIDEDNYLYLSGRIKDLIIRGGENISPLEVEKKISNDGNIRECKVMGVPHPVFGESVVACVTCADDALFDESAIKDSLKGELASFKIPSVFFVFDSFPVAANGKTDQRALKIMMLNRYRDLELKDRLEKGECVFKLVIRNTFYNIVPTASMLESFALTAGFGKARAAEIRLCVEEMLTERIINAYADVGEISLKLVFFKDYFRVVFTDRGFEYDIHKDEASNYSAQIILGHVDAFTTSDEEDGYRSYSMDFIYENSFDIKSFLKNRQEKN